MKSLPSLLSIGLAINLAYANSDPLSTEYQKFQQQNQHQIEQLQQYQQQKWLENRQYQGEQNPQATATDLSQQCLPYRRVIFADFSLINPKPYAPQEGECINEVRLNQLSQDITNAYLQQGYIHNPFQFEDDRSDVLTMRVKEGKVAKLTSDSQRLNLAMLFPDLVGKPLNVKDLDQGLDQANKMNGSNVSVDVLPAENGEVELAFKNEEKSPLTGFVGLDNYASKRHQRWQAKAGVNVDSPLGLSDSLYVGLNHSLKSVRQDFNRSASLMYSVPYGYWHFSAFGAFSQFRSKIPLQFSEIVQKGKTWQANLRADYTASRGSNYISTLYAQLEHLRSRSYFEDSLLLLQSPRLTTAQLGFNHLQLLENGSMSVDLSYERGLPIWGAIRNQGDDQPQGQFDRLTGEVQLNFYHRPFGKIFRQSHRLIGQFSPNYLPAVKQADLLGRYAVRGFNDLNDSAERSLVLQNNLGWIIQQAQWQIEPYLGLDLGIQKAKGDTTKAKGLGYAAGLKWNGSNAQIQTEWATGRLFQKNQRIKQERSWNLNFSYFF